MSDNEKYAGIPITRARQSEIDYLVYMMCSLSKFTEDADQVEKRIKSIPNGWRDMRMIISVLQSLVEKMLRTLPMEKRETLYRLVPDIRYTISYHKRVGRADEPISGIYTKDLDILCWATHEYLCKLCDGKCQQCDIGKAFDRMIGTDREENESYSFKELEDSGIVIGGKKVGG